MSARPLLIVFFLALCGCPFVNTTTVPSYSSYTDSSSKYISKIISGNTPGAPAPDVVDKAVSIFVKVCNEKLSVGTCAAAIKDVELAWSGVVAPSPTTGVLNTVVVYQGNLYSGLTVGNKVMVAWRGKISRSALAHELCHVVGVGILGDPNKDHTNQLLAELEQSTNQALVKAGL